MIGSSLRHGQLAGFLPPQAKPLPERHLGLVLPQEQDNFDSLLDAMADSLQLDASAWDTILQQARSAWQALPHAATLTPLPPLLAGCRIAVARDAASCFIYPQNLDCLQAMGAELQFFSPLANEDVPNADAIWLPGGYPELHAASLSQAAITLQGLRHAHAAGIPIWAECGGMMLLAEQLHTVQGQAYPMAGLLAGSVRQQARIIALGPQAWDTPQGELRGHTFHFSELHTSLSPSAHCRSHPTGAAGEAVYQRGSLRASWFHPWFPSNPQATAALFRPDSL